MNKLDLSEYLANLSIIMEAQEALGIQRSATVANEYQRCYTQLKEAIEDETRSESNVERRV